MLNIFLFLVYYSFSISGLCLQLLVYKGHPLQVLLKSFSMATALRVRVTGRDTVLLVRNNLPSISADKILSWCLTLI